MINTVPGRYENVALKQVQAKCQESSAITVQLFNHIVPLDLEP